jgi:hypothetical protein
MDTRLICVLLLFPLAILADGCSKSSPTGVPDDSNLLTNSSFELNGVPSMQGWTIVSGDSSLLFFSSDVPPAGGASSIAFTAGWGPACRISTMVSAFPGTHHYRVSVWAKRVGIGGSLRFYLKPANSPWAFRKSLMVTDTVWTAYSMTDSLATTGGDSLVVSISGGISQLLSGTTFYDLCELEKLD